MTTIHFEIPIKYLELAGKHLACKTNNQDIVDKIQKATNKAIEANEPIVMQAKDFEDEGQLFLGLSFCVIGKLIE